MSATQGKPITCKAAVAWEKEKPLSIETVEVAPPEEGEVRIKVVSTGICHSDLSYLNNELPGILFPILLGHEAAGIVESVGEGVTFFEPGDKVIPLFVPQCEECVLCKSPETNLCFKLLYTIDNDFEGKSKRLVIIVEGLISIKVFMFSPPVEEIFEYVGSGTTGGFESVPKGIKCKGQPLTQMAKIGSFSEYTVLPQSSLTKISPDAPLDKVALFGCCIPTGYGSAAFCAKVHKGSSCAIWGLGGVGMSVVMGCRARGASKIIGVDINPNKFPLAKKLGCTDVVNPKDHSEPIEKVVSNMTNGGADYTFVSVGSKAAADSALKASHVGWGKSILIGLVPGEVSTDSTNLLMGRKWIGTFCGDAKGRSDIPKLVEDYLDGKLPSDELITSTIKLEDINKGFELLKSGQSLRTVVLM